MEAEGRVREEQDGVMRASSKSVHESAQVLVNRNLAPAVNCQGAHFVGQPFIDLVVPVLHQAAWAHHNGLLDSGLAVRALSQQGPHECYALQGLAQTHLIRHDAAVKTLDLVTRDTVIHELDPLPLMWPEDPA